MRCNEADDTEMKSEGSAKDDASDEPADGAKVAVVKPTKAIALMSYLRRAWEKFGGFILCGMQRTPS